MGIGADHDGRETWPDRAPGNSRSSGIFHPEVCCRFWAGFFLFDHRNIKQIKRTKGAGDLGASGYLSK
jgi:hypothetical protein